MARKTLMPSHKGTLFGHVQLSNSPIREKIGNNKMKSRNI
jgi:hypothetical protein